VWKLGYGHPKRSDPKFCNKRLGVGYGAPNNTLTRALALKIVIRTTPTMMQLIPTWHDLSDLPSTTLLITIRDLVEIIQMTPTKAALLKVA
jgi:hypothetical protein